MTAYLTPMERRRQQAAARRAGDVAAEAAVRQLLNPAEVARLLTPNPLDPEET